MKLFLFRCVFCGTRAKRAQLKPSHQSANFKGSFCGYFGQRLLTPKSRARRSCAVLLALNSLLVNASVQEKQSCWNTLLYRWSCGGLCVNVACDAAKVQQRFRCFPAMISLSPQTILGRSHRIHSVMRCCLMCALARTHENWPFKRQL